MNGIVLSIVVAATSCAAGPGDFEKDVVETSAGELEIVFIGHGTLEFRFGGKEIHVDPWSRLTDYADVGKADLILITHEHMDHLDLKAIEALRGEDTTLIVNPTSAEKLEGAEVMQNGDTRTVAGVGIEAVPAYNLVGKRPNGVPFHAKGEHNGYVLTFGETRVYVAGDTENTPEMKQLKDIDIAFLPMNQPYTMTPEMVADAVKAFKPKVLYPYHYGKTKVSDLTALLADLDEVEIRVRSME